MLCDQYDNGFLGNIIVERLEAESLNVSPAIDTAFSFIALADHSPAFAEELTHRPNRGPACTHAKLGCVSSE